MQEKVKHGLYLALAVISLVIMSSSCALWQERASLGEQRQELQQELSVTKQFAAAHKDYEAYVKSLQAQKTKLERELFKRSSSAGCLKLVQRLAAEQGVQLKSVQNIWTEAGALEKKSGTQLKISADSDYFSAVRWLRKLEREGVVISELRVQKEQLSTQTLQLEMLIKLHNVNL